MSTIKELVQIPFVPTRCFYGQDEIKNIQEMIFETKLMEDGRENLYTITADASANTKKRLTSLSSPLYTPNKVITEVRYTSEDEDYSFFCVVSLALFFPVFKMKCHAVGCPSVAMLNPKMLPKVGYTTDAY